MKRLFDEVHVYEGVGERTGVCIDRDGVRGRRGVCRSIGEMVAKARRLGDGYYYLASAAWPADSVSVNLTQPWISMGSMGSKPEEE